MNIPFICSNIPAAPAYGVYITKLIRYSRACGSYKDFLDRGLLLTWKLLNKGFLLVNLKSSLRKFYGCHHDLVDRFCVTNDHGYVPFVVNGPFLIHDLSPDCNYINTTGATSGEGTAYPSRGSPPVFSVVCVTRYLVLCVYFVDRCLFFCPFSFGHCVACPSTINGF